MKKVVPARTPRVFAIQHPKMSEALIMEDIAGRTYPQLIVWAQIAVMKGFGVELPNRKEWIVTPISDTFDNAPVPIDLFEEVRNTQQKEQTS